MAKEIESIAITNWDTISPVQVTVVVCTDDPTKNGVVVCKADWTPL